MTDVRTTRCPQCHTVFRVTEAQLGAHAGQVRCGHCRRVFDGRQSLLPVGELERTTAGPSSVAPLPSGATAAAPTSAQELPRSALPADGVRAATMSAPGPVTEGLEVAKAAGSSEAAATHATVGKEGAEARASAAAEPAAEAEAAAAAEQAAKAEAVADAEPAADVAASAGVEAAAKAGPAAAEQATEVEQKAGPDGAIEAKAGAAAVGSEDREARPAELARPVPAGDEVTAAELRSQAPDLAAGPPAGTEAASHGFSWERRDEGDRRWVWALLVPLLALLLAAQAAYQLRHLLAARLPALRPVLIAGCQWIGCRIEPPRSRDRLSIEASELQADPAHRGLLVLTATLRNRADMAIAYPHLELTLTDLQQQAVARRAFAPGEYAGGTAQLEAGIPANGEIILKLFIDASATQQQGYRLYLFYP